MFADSEKRKCRKENIRCMQECSPILTLHAAVVQSTAAVCKLCDDLAPVVITQVGAGVDVVRQNGLLSSALVSPAALSLRDARPK